MVTKSGRFGAGGIQIRRRLSRPLALAFGGRRIRWYALDTAQNVTEQAGVLGAPQRVANALAANVGSCSVLIASWKNDELALRQPSALP